MQRWTFYNLVSHLGSRVSLAWDEAREVLDLLGSDFQWKPDDFVSGSGRRYLAGSKTQLAAYHQGTDWAGVVEVALAADNLAAGTGRSIDEILFWISALQRTVGAYARPKSRYKYPRISVSNLEQLTALVVAVRSLLSAKSDDDFDAAVPLPDRKILQAIWSRRGQRQFRRRLLESYGGRCAITGCKTIAVLEAAHITPYSEEQHYDVGRGILLRADIHTLFDLALVSIDPDSRKVVVKPVAGHDYGQYANRIVARPMDERLSPTQEELTTHFQRFNQMSLTANANLYIER